MQHIMFLVNSSTGLGLVMVCGITTANGLWYVVSIEFKNTM